MGVKIVVSAGLGVLFAFAYLTAIRPAYGLAYGLALIFALAGLWSWRAGSRLGLSRSVSATGRSVGDSFVEAITVIKRSRIPAPWIEVRDQSWIPGYQPGRVVAMGWGAGRRTWSSRGVFRQRGWVCFGPTRALIREPFGLFTHQLEFSQREPLLIHPRIWKLPDLLLAAPHHLGGAQSQGAGSDQPPQASGIREYVPGDSFGRIHWPLSARTGQLVSRTFEQPLTTDLWILLDLERQVHFGSGRDSTLEHAVSLAASVAVQVHSQGRRVGLLATDQAGTWVHPVAPEGSSVAMEPILDFLAVAQADGSAPLASALVGERLRRLSGRALALITPSTAGGWAGALHGLSERGTHVMIFHIDAADFGAPRGEGLAGGLDADLYVLGKGEDQPRLVRVRNADKVS